MSSETQIDQIAERVERLLLRHAELQQRNAALARELEQARQQRDALEQRLASAAARLDLLLAQLPRPEGDPA
jgi:cell division protein ZapB